MVLVGPFCLGLRVKEVGGWVGVGSRWEVERQKTIKKYSNIVFCWNFQYEHWQTYIKNIYEDYPNMNVMFTGSSMLKLSKGEGDLSRRVAMYTMIGLSFREYLMFENVLQFEKLDLEDILNHHVQIATEITEKIHILPYLENYYRHG